MRRKKLKTLCPTVERWKKASGGDSRTKKQEKIAGRGGVHTSQMGMLSGLHLQPTDRVTYWSLCSKQEAPASSASSFSRLTLWLIMVQAAGSFSDLCVQARLAITG